MKRSLLAAIVLAGCAVSVPLPREADEGRGAAHPPLLAPHGRPLGVRPFAHDALVTALAFSPDGERLATGSLDGTVRVFDLEGREIARRAAHADEVTFVGWLASGTLVSAGLDQGVRVGDLAFVVSGAAPRVAVSGERVAFTVDGDTVAVLEPGGEIGRVTLHRVAGVALSPSGDRLAVASASTASVWDIGRAGKITRRLPLADAPPSLLAFFDETRLAVGYGGAVVEMRMSKLEDLDGRDDPFISAHDTDAIAITRDGTLATASRANDPAQSFVSIERFARPRLVVGVPMVRAAIALSPYGRLLAAASSHGVVLLDTTTGEEVSGPPHHRSPISELSCHGAVVESLGADGALIAWETSRATATRFLARGGSGHVYARAARGFVAIDAKILHGATTGAFSPGGELLALGSPPGVVVLVERDTGTVIRSWRSGTVAMNAHVDRIAFSRDGSAVAAQFEGHLRVFDVASGADRSPADIACLGFAFTPGGLVWLDERATLGPSGVALHLPYVTEVPPAPATLACFSPDGELVALAVGRKLAIHETRTGHRLASLEGHRREIKALAFSEEGDALVSGDASGALWTWELRASK